MILSKKHKQSPKDKLSREIASLFPKNYNYDCQYYHFFRSCGTTAYGECYKRDTTRKREDITFVVSNAAKYHNITRPQHPKVTDEMTDRIINHLCNREWENPKLLEDTYVRNFDLLDIEE